MKKQEIAKALVILFDMESKYAKELEKCSKECLEQIFEGVKKNAAAYREIEEFFLSQKAAAKN